jgi:hypothetical protein
MKIALRLLFNANNQLIRAEAWKKPSQKWTEKSKCGRGVTTDGLVRVNCHPWMLETGSNAYKALWLILSEPVACKRPSAIGLSADTPITSTGDKAQS